MFGAGRHHSACSICADEGGGGGSAARTKRRSHDRKRNTRRSHPKQSHASTRWCNARDTDERRMMRRATYPKRRSKRCAREGTPRAVSFRECGNRGWRVGFSTDRFRRRGLVLQKNVILTKTPYVACIGNTVEKDGQMTQTPEDFGAHFRRDDGNFSCFCFSHPLDSSSSARTPRGRTHPRAGARERHTTGVASSRRGSWR